MDQSGRPDQGTVHSNSTGRRRHDCCTGLMFGRRACERSGASGRRRVLSCEGAPARQIDPRLRYDTPRSTRDAPEHRQTPVGSIPALSTSKSRGGAPACISDAPKRPPAICAWASSGWSGRSRCVSQPVGRQDTRRLVPPRPARGESSADGAPPGVSAAPTGGIEHV
jgi:hypothetical protein